MKFDQVKFGMWKDDFHDGISLYILGIDRRMEGDVVGRPQAYKVVFDKVERDHIDASLPAENEYLYLSNMSAQNLMDRLWDAGFRPTEGKGSAGSLAATEAHLKDMRDIAFSLKNMVEEALRKMMERKP